MTNGAIIGCVTLFVKSSLVLVETRAVSLCLRVYSYSTSVSLSAILGLEIMALVGPVCVPERAAVDSQSNLAFYSKPC